MSTLTFRIGEVQQHSRGLEVTIETVGQKFPVTTVVRDHFGKFSTTVLLKEAQSLSYRESFRGFKRRDPYLYGKVLKELWDRIDHENDTVEQLIACIQKAESRLQKAVRARDRQHLESLIAHHD